MPVYDIHAHVYPDAIAARAADAIGRFYELPMEGDGTAEGLLKRSRAAGISRSVIHSAAVTPDKVTRINDFLSRTAAAHPEELTAFGTLHPGLEDAEAEADRMIALGLKGVKLHPDFQHFELDCPAALRMFHVLAERDLPVLIHVGDYRYTWSAPERMARVLKEVPRLKAVCAHMGGWSLWNEGWKVLAGLENARCDCSSSLYALEPEKAAEILRHWGTERVFFGTDFPMWDPVGELERFMALPLTDTERERILWKNLREYLDLP